MAHQNNSRPHRTTRHHLNGVPREFDDVLAVEGPIQVKLQAGDVGPIDYAVLMRTPGHDEELLYGLLYSESIIHHSSDITHIREIGQNPAVDEYLVELQSPGMLADLAARNMAGHSGCGVCAMDSAERLLSEIYPVLPLKKGIFTARDVMSFKKHFTSRQTLFSQTGGSHATILLTSDGSPILIREDVGRHNAMDKAIGYMLWKSPATSVHIALVSGRLSYEIVHKALKAKIPVLAGLGAPSSMAVRLAAENNLTLIGFLSHEKFNIYTHTERIKTN